MGYMVALRAEFRKLFTIRSTYIILLLMLALVGLFAFYIAGIRVNPLELAAAGPHYLLQQMSDSVTFLAIFPAIIATLIITHEYRYNTILYTLTSSPSRLRILLAKFTTVTIFSVISTTFFTLLTLGFVLVGLKVHGMHAIAQSIPWHSLIWQSLFYAWGMAIVGLLFGVLVRSQIASIAMLLLIPGLAEQLLGLLLKENAKYLPFTALDHVLGVSTGAAASGSTLSAGQGVAVFLAYLVIGWIVAVVLFLRRDVN